MSRVNSLDMYSCALHMGCWVISPNALIPFQISVLTDQLNPIHRGVRSRECLSHMALPCGLLEATPSRNTRVNSLDMSSCALHMGCWVISPNALIPSRISVLTDQLNSIHRVRSRECLSHMALPCGLLEATPSKNTRVSSHSV